MGCAGGDCGCDGRPGMASAAWGRSSGGADGPVVYAGGAADALGASAVPRLLGEVTACRAGFDADRLSAASTCTSPCCSAQLPLLWLLLLLM